MDTSKGTAMKVLVLGGAGFIGRSAVEALLARGHEVVIGTRRPARAESRGVAVDLTHIEKIELHRFPNARDWLERIAPFDVVVNCAGILRERWGESFDVVYRQTPVAIAEACATLGKRFLHVTALGLSVHASSGFITAKLAGERGIEAIDGESCIVRPSLLDGRDGFGSRWIRRVAQWPVHFIPADASGRLAPLHVRDLGEAIAALCVCPRELLPGSVELGGEVHYSMAQYLNALRVSARPALRLRVPAWVVRMCAHMLDVVHLTPLSWGHVELMRRDNVPCHDDIAALRRWIGRAPVKAGAQPLATPQVAIAGGAMVTPLLRTGIARFHNRPLRSVIGSGENDAR